MSGQTPSPRLFRYAAYGAVAMVVVVANFAVQYPVGVQLFGVYLGDLLTYGALVFPIAFLVTDVINRVAGPKEARNVVIVGFFVGLVVTAILVTPRLAIASLCAFLVGQHCDIWVFDRLRHGRWWRAPLVSSIIGSALDTALFFSIAFSGAFDFLGELSPDFARELSPFLTLFSPAPLWVSWLVADFAVKVLVSAMALAPYGFMLRAFRLRVA